MANISQGEPSHFSLANTVIRNYAENFERHSYVLLGSLSLFVLSLSLFAFLEVWYGSYTPILVLRLQISLAISVMFVVFVGVFWSLLAKPYFQILLVENASQARQQPRQSLLERMFQARGKTIWHARTPMRPSLFLLFPAFFALGLVLSTIISQFNAFPLFIYYDTFPGGAFVNPSIPPIRRLARLSCVSCFSHRFSRFI